MQVRTPAEEDWGRPSNFAGGASAATDDDASYVGILPFGAFRRHLAELQEAIDEVAESHCHALPGGVHLRLCAASKALYNDLSFGCPANRLWHMQQFGDEAESALTNLQAELARLRVPKSPKTPLMCYKKEWIPWFASNNPNLSVGAVQQLMHDAFARLDEAGKQPYVDLAMADRERYAQACEDRKGVFARACVELRSAEDALRRLRTLLGRHPPCCANALYHDRGEI